MKMYDCPKGSKIRLIGGGDILTFDHIDGMFSFCLAADGEIVHLAAWSDVEIVETEEIEDGQ